MFFRRAFLLFLAALFAGCVPEKADLDGDGTPDAEDCGAENRLVFPGAAEVCNGLDDNCDDVADEGLPTVVVYSDGDNDGYGDPATRRDACDAFPGDALNDHDCDDTHGAIYPGADEICDGVDNDCDELVDTADSELVPLYLVYPDADHDGSGAAGADPVGTCTVDQGWSVDATDCDDADPALHPDGHEVCDGLDDDCDGLVDDADPSLTGAPQWWPDVDLDSYADPHGAAVAACISPLGYRSFATDCDDTRADVHPGAGHPACSEDVDYDCDGVIENDDADADGWDACDDCDESHDDVFPGAEESCNDRDDDCDGLIDIDDGLPAYTVYYDYDRDGYGDTRRASTACAESRYEAFDGGDCDDTDNAVYPGARETCATEYDDNCNGDTNEPSSSGCSYYIHDADGDGHGDTVADRSCLCEPTEALETLGSTRDDCNDADPATYTGAPEVCGDFADNDCDGEDGCTVADLTILVSDPDHTSGLGGGLAAGGDFDGDGVGDLAVSSPGAADGVGRVDVYQGTSAGPVSVLLASLDGLGTAGGTGAELAVGDGDGDGFVDLYYGDSTTRDGAAEEFGTVVWVQGPLPAHGDASSATGGFHGDHPRSTLGLTVAWAGDLTGDGAPDLAVGDVHSSLSPGGVVHILSADPEGYSLASAGESYLYEDVAVGVGAWVAAGHDVNGDGATDVVTSTDSQVFVHYGPLTGANRAADSDVTLTTPLLQAMSTAVDADHDGVDDLLCTGQEGMEVYTVRSPGVMGVEDARFRVPMSDGSSTAGYRASLVDLNGDGWGDLIAPNVDRTATRSYFAVFLGPLIGTSELSDTLLRWRGEGDVANVGRAVDRLGDVDGDGREDAAILSDGTTSSSADIVYLLFGSDVP